MKSPPDLTEFARLKQLWLDGLATAEEAAAHWRMVAEHEECSRELAAAARFEALLEKRLGEAEQLKRAEMLLRSVATGKEKRSGSWRGMLKPALSVAAVMTVVGMLWWVLSQEGWREGAVNRGVGFSMRQPKINQPRVPLAQVPSTEESWQEGAVLWTPEALRVWLDAYFLKGVALNKVTLKEALGEMQADMLAVNFLNAEVVSRLRVTVSADAAGRRVSLKSGPISFLKAVQTLAAQAGCEVEVGELLLAVESREQPFPQPTARHDLREVLAGRFDSDGVAESDRPDLMAKVWADAVDQGFVVAEAVGTGPVRLTQGQVETLRGLAEARAQLDQMPTQEYQLRRVAAGTLTQGRVLDAAEVRGFLAQPTSGSQTSVVTVKPGQRVALEGEQVGLPRMEVEFLPVGQGFQVGLLAVPVQWVPSGRANLAGSVGGTEDSARQLYSNALEATTPGAVVVMSGQGAVLNLDSVSSSGLGIRSEIGTLGMTTNDTQQSVMTGSMSNSSSAVASQVLLLPVNPTGETPP
jgi:hypothetical protein